MTAAADIVEIDLREHDRSVPVRLPLRARQALMQIGRGRLDVLATPDPDRFTLVTHGWVGALTVPGMVVRIAPSAPMENLFTMFSAGISGDDWGSESIGWAGEFELVDGVAAFVLRAIDEATRRGLLHGYRSRIEELSVLRGRIRIQELAGKPWMAAKPPCEYDDFTPDIEENRLLRAAVRCVLRWPTLPPTIRRDGLRLLSRFEQVDDQDVATWGAHGLTPAITRLNEHYGPAMQLSRMVLDGVSISHLEGGQDAATFLIDTAEVFRRWVTLELHQRLWPDVLIDERPTHSLDVQNQLQFVPDMLMRRGPRAMLVADVVYHLGGSPGGPSTDYFPLLTYAAALGLGAGMLIYAQADDPPTSELVVRSIGTRLISVPLRLSVPPARLAGSLDTLAELVRVVGVGAMNPMTAST